MFKSTSKAGTGWALILTSLIMAVAQQFDIQVTEAELYPAVQGVVLVAGIVLTIIGQVFRDDLIAGLFRKEKK